MILFFLKEFFVFAFAFVCNLPGLTLQVISPAVYLHWHLRLGCFPHLSFLFSCFSWLLSDCPSSAQLSDQPRIWAEDVLKLLESVSFHPLQVICVWTAGFIHSSPSSQDCLYFYFSLELSQISFVNVYTFSVRHVFNIQESPC